MKTYLYLLFVTTVIGLVTCQEPQQMSFSSPELSEEEQHSGFVPDNLKCDACTAVTYQMKLALEKEELKKGGRKLLESDYLDVFENVCDSNTFKNYGIKNVQGTNRLSGKGLEADDTPGMLMGGGKWPSRMSSKCFEFIDELGEDEIYNRFRNKRNLKDYLCRQVTKDCVETSKKEL